MIQGIEICPTSSAEVSFLFRNSSKVVVYLER